MSIVFLFDPATKWIAPFYCCFEENLANSVRDHATAYVGNIGRSDLQVRIHTFSCEEPEENYFEFAFVIHPNDYIQVIKTDPDTNKNFQTAVDSIAATHLDEFENKVYKSFYTDYHTKRELIERFKKITIRKRRYYCGLYAPPINVRDIEEDIHDVLEMDFKEDDSDVSP
jgi:hypothetical protein